MKEGEVRHRIWAVDPVNGGDPQMFYPRPSGEVDCSGLAITIHGQVVWLYDSFYDNCDQNYWIDVDEPEIMRSTGHQDSCDKEIWEDDIVEIRREGVDFERYHWIKPILWAQVKWNADHSSFEYQNEFIGEFLVLSPERHVIDNGVILNRIPYKVFVRGNIWENPTLLEERS